MTGTRISVRTLVEDMVAAANRGDLDAQAQHFHPEITYRFKAYGVDVAGREAFRALLGGMLATFPDRQVTVTAVLVDGYRGAMQYEYSGTSPGGPGLPPVGRFSTELCAVFTIRDGLIADMRDYLDRPLS